MGALDKPNAEIEMALLKKEIAKNLNKKRAKQPLRQVVLAQQICDDSRIFLLKTKPYRCVATVKVATSI